MTDPLPRSPLPSEVDGVFVGGGHNSLVAAAYLARAGLSVLVLESADRIGGGVTTQEVTLPLFRHNLHAFFVRWTPDYRIWHDLDLGRYGLEAVYPDVQNGLPFDGGDRALVTYADVDRSVASIAKLSARDAKAYARLHPRLAELTSRIEAPLRFAPPLPPEEVRARLSHSRVGRRYLEIAERSVLDLVTDWFESEPLRALVAFNAAVRGYVPNLDVPGTGYILVLALPNSHEGRIIRGGSGEAARALATDVFAHGGRVEVAAPVAAIDVREGHARLVTTADGRSVAARRFVASSVPAPITLLELVGGEHLDSGIRTAMEEYRWLEEALFGVHLALREPPRFKAEDEEPDLPRALNLALGYESTDDLIRDMEAVRRREVPAEAALHASVPTLNDPSQAPPGHHTTFGWQFVPSRPLDRWEDPGTCQAQVKAMLACYERYAPRLPDHTLAVASHSPAATERMVPSMLGGDRHHGSYHPLNWGASRPHEALSSYRTPVEGLYLCGSSQHPGGSFTGIPGFNAAGVIADDLGIEPWWPRPDPRQVLEDLA